jgi:hypothetical protein
MANKSKNKTSRERQRMSTQQIIFVVISLIIIAAWVLGMIYQF